MTVSPTEVVALLRAAAQTVATCESLTAGLLAATIAEVPGASAVLRGGLIVYATDLKSSLAEVDSQLLAEHGPVSEAVALAMASGARERCAADWAIALTGVAGPTPQDGHPVGTVWCAVAGAVEASATSHLLSGERQDIRRAAVTVGLAALAARLR